MAPSPQTRDAGAAYTSSATAAEGWSQSQASLNREVARGKDAVSDAWQPTNLLAGALQDVSSAASEADQSAQFLQMSLDKLAGKDVDAEQAARANAAAMREMVSAHRDIAAAKADVAEKTDALTAAQKAETTSDYTAEQKARDVAAAKRDLADANDGVKDATDRFKDSQDKAAASAIQRCGCDVPSDGEDAGLQRCGRCGYVEDGSPAGRVRGVG
jgi:predicted  nucleic acid-binding Zn-ribbon protein